MNMSCADDEHVMRMFLGSRLLATARHVFLALRGGFLVQKPAAPTKPCGGFLAKTSHTLELKPAVVEGP